MELRQQGQVDEGVVAAVRGLGAAVDVAHVAGGEVQREGLREQGEHDVLLHLVVQHHRLAHTLRGKPLPPHRRVADGDGQSLRQLCTGGRHEADPCLDHGEVADLAVRRRDELPLRRDLVVARAELVARDAHVVEAAAAVLVGVEPHRRPGGAERHARHGQVVLQRAELHHEGEDAVVRLADDEPRVDDRVRRDQAQAARPPLRRRDRGGVDHEFIRRRVEGGGGLEPADVGAVAHLGLGV